MIYQFPVYFFCNLYYIYCLYFIYIFLCSVFCILYLIYSLITVYSINIYIVIQLQKFKYINANISNNIK